MTAIQFILTIIIRAVSVLPVFRKKVCLPGFDTNGNSTVNYTILKQNLISALSDQKMLMTTLIVCIILSLILSVLSLVMKSNRSITILGKIVFIVLALVFALCVILVLKTSPKY